MIYISAVGMVNALGNSANEIAENLARGVAPGMHSRAGWLQGGEEIVLGGVEVDEHESIPFISQLANLGEIDTSGVADPAAP